MLADRQKNLYRGVYDDKGDLIREYFKRARIREGKQLAK